MNGVTEPATRGSTSFQILEVSVRTASVQQSLIASVLFTFVSFGSCIQRGSMTEVMAGSSTFGLAQRMVAESPP